MTVSKTQLLQMGFTRRGSPFVMIGAKSSIDLTGISDFTSRGMPVYGPSNTTTPVYPTLIPSPVRQGRPFRITALRQIRYGGVYRGQPIFSQLPNPTYPTVIASPVRQGSPFKWVTAKPSIDASSDYVTQGQPFYVYYNGSTPVFNATRFFIVF